MKKLTKRKGSKLDDDVNVELPGGGGFNFLGLNNKDALLVAGTSALAGIVAGSIYYYKKGNLKGFKFPKITYKKDRK